MSSKETLTQILRTYALIDQTMSAEEVIREELVAPFIQEVYIIFNSFFFIISYNIIIYAFYRLRQLSSPYLKTHNKLHPLL